MWAKSYQCLQKNWQIDEKSNIRINDLKCTHYFSSNSFEETQLLYSIIQIQLLIYLFKSNLLQPKNIEILRHFVWKKYLQRILVA